MEKDHEEARRIAEESMVLLKNDEQILPLKASEKLLSSVVLQRSLVSRAAEALISTASRSQTHWIPFLPMHRLLMQKVFLQTKDLYDDTLATEAIKTAAAADKVVIFAGLPDSFESEGYDRSHMRLPECQNRLIAEILKVQPNTVIVLHNGSPVELPWLNDIKGLLEAYLGGQAGGTAVANILYGK